MRLLERNAAREIRLKEHLDDNVPQYAILSHTWGDEEVVFEDFMDGVAKNKAQNKRGYKKIQFCGDQAWRDGLAHFWVDTCCINKANNTELQESINSMFRWYRDAAKCYVYLSDVSRHAVDADENDASSQTRWKSAFRKSRWFTRGWTLQELIAPASVEFFSEEGERLGDKGSLEESIYEITGIPRKVLRGRPLSGFSVSERLKWAETRQTTRKEDRAYSLLGIFNIYMTLIYGEGEENAFRRLKKKINGASKIPVPVASNAAFDSFAEGDAPTCHPETRIDLLRQIDEWANRRQGEPIFWLNGMAGTGKSTISRTVARSFDGRSQLGASFFFKRGDGDRGKVDKFFTTIAAQLAVAVPAVAAHARDAINSDPAVVEKAMAEQFDKLILKPLSEVPEESISEPLVLVVDALDECDECGQEKNAKQIIGLFSRVKALRSVRLKIFVTSRPELPIRLGFAAIYGSYKDVVLHEIPEHIVEHDISAYLQTELGRIRDDFNALVSNSPERRLPPDWPGQPTVLILVDMAVPLFIFAATVCRFLEDRRCGDPDDQLQIVLKFRTQSQGSKFDAAYSPVLNQLLEKGPESLPLTPLERRYIIDDFQTIVGSIINLASPLPIASLAHLLNLPERRVHSRLDFLHSVLSVPAPPSPVRLLHLSFRDFLVDPQKRGSSPFWIDEKETHKHLAAHCLRVMNANLRPDLCRLQAPGTPRSAIDPRRISDNIPPEIEYACLYWAYHVEQAKITLRDGGEQHSFLCRHFLHWLEALSLMGRVSESIGILRSLQSLGQPKDSTELSRFLDDGLRIALASNFIIDLAPLQIYSSVLAFAPQKSIIRQAFKKQIPKWILLGPEPEADWNQCLRILEGHSGLIVSVAFSSDAALVASASEDQTIRLWCTETGECMQVLEGHSAWVNSVAFSPDAALVASASNDTTVRLWRADTGECVLVLKGHSGSVNSVSFSPHEELVASASGDRTVRLWRAETGECVQVIQGHCGSVNSVSFSPDAAFVMSASDDMTVRLWRAETGECVQILKGHSRKVRSAAFSSDAALVASASYDQRVRLWRTETGECVRVLEGHSGAVTSVAFSPDATLVASASSDQTVWLWRAETGECLQVLKGHSGSVNSVSFSPNAVLVASASCDQTVRLWHPETGECVHVPKGHSASVNSVAFSPDAALVASASDDQTVRLWLTETSECVQVLEGHSGSVNSVSFSPDAVLVASASDDMTVQLWITETGERAMVLKGHSGSVKSVAFSPDAEFVASASYDHTIQLWRVETGECVQVLKGHSAWVNSIAFSYNATLIASASYNRTVRLWRAQTGECVQGRYSWVNSVAFSHDAALAASASDDQTVWLWRAETGECVQVLKGHSAWVSSVALSPDSTLVASASYDRTVRLWCAETGECVQALKGHSGEVNLVTFSHDAALAASASYDRTVRLWRAESGECVQVLKGHSAWVKSVAFSPDAALVASASYDQTVRLWRVEVGKCVQVLKGHSRLVNSVAFSPDATLVASASYDQTVRLWRTETGECVQVLEGHSGLVNSVAFSPDVALVASASGDRTVRLWRADTGECVQVLEGHSGEVNSVSFSPDATLVAAASVDQTLRLSRAETSECIPKTESGTGAYELVFNRDGSRLLTSVGSVDIRRPQTVATASPGTSSYQPMSACSATRHIGSGISSDRCWVTWNGENLLWLPVEFRPTCSTISGSVVAIGCSSGRVTIMGFLAEELRAVNSTCING